MDVADVDDDGGGNCDLWQVCRCFYIIHFRLERIKIVHELSPFILLRLYFLLLNVFLFVQTLTVEKDGEKERSAFRQTHIIYFSSVFMLVLGGVYKSFRNERRKNKEGRNIIST